MIQTRTPLLCLCSAVIYEINGFVGQDSRFIGDVVVLMAVEGGTFPENTGFDAAVTISVLIIGVIYTHRWS